MPPHRVEFGEAKGVAPGVGSVGSREDQPRGDEPVAQLQERRRGGLGSGKKRHSVVVLMVIKEPDSEAKHAGKKECD